MSEGKKENQLTLFDMKEWWEDDWEGMPEFDQNNMAPFHTINVHFANRKDMEDFEKLVMQNINKTTKWMWYPKKEKVCRFGRMYIDES